MHLTVEERLKKLEVSSARWRTASALLVFLVILLFTMGQTRPASDVIEAKRIVFRDRAGRIRMELRADEDGKAPKTGLFLMDQNGEEVASLHQVIGRDAGGKTLQTYLVVHESASARKESAKASLDMALALTKSATQPAEEQSLKNWVREETAKIDDLGACTWTATGESTTIADLRPSGPHLTVISTDRACVPSLFVGGDVTAAVGTPQPRGSVTVVDGRVEVKDSTSHQNATLGTTELVDKRTGAVTKLPVSSLTLCDKDGNVLLQVPR